MIASRWGTHRRAEDLCARCQGLPRRWPRRGRGRWCRRPQQLLVAGTRNSRVALARARCSYRRPWVNACRIATERHRRRRHTMYPTRKRAPSRADATLNDATGPSARWNLRQHPGIFIFFVALMTNKIHIFLCLY